MMTPDLLAALQAQVNLERYAGALYFALRYAAHAANLDGVAHFFAESGADEAKHAALFAEYLTDRNAPVIVDTLPPVAPPADVARMFQMALGQERAVTASLTRIYALAEEANDPATCAILYPLISEQVKSERELERVLARLAMGATVIMVDEDLAE